VKGVELPAEWVAEADVFIREAERHVGEGIYWLTCFEAQQAAELYLKALIVGLAGSHPYTHDIVEMLETLKGMGFDVPETLVVYGDALTPHYTLARYPGRKPFEHNHGRGVRCLEQARNIVEWVKKIADP